VPNGLLVGALRAQERLKPFSVFAGEAGLPGACSDFSDTLLEPSEGSLLVTRTRQSIPRVLVPKSHDAARKDSG
jgi:hypothetical protein